MLVLFDIDGTLTRTADLDVDPYATAFLRTFGSPLPSLDWSSYRNASESGVAIEAATELLGRPPTAGELDKMQDEYMALLTLAMKGQPAKELEMPGASRLLQGLVEEGHHVALATGCWRRSAEAKLDAAGLDCAGIPIATADDAVERTAIMTLAAIRAGFDPKARHVYIGDGLWDMRASAALGWEFIGVGPTGCRLEQLGVDRLLPHFGDHDLVYELLAACA